MNNAGVNVQRYVLIPSAVLTDSERNTLFDKSRLNAASSTVHRLERQIASIASDPNLSVEHKAAQLKSTVSGLDSATRDYLHRVGDVSSTNVDDGNEDSIPTTQVQDSNATLPYYTRPPTDPPIVAPIEESLASKESLLTPAAVIQEPSTQTEEEPVAEIVSPRIDRPNKRFFANFKNKFYHRRSGRKTTTTKRLIDEI